jgi:putative tryptophan/tyrosine transport system substrate-binding protein
MKMQRRSFITLVGGAAAAWPLTARAQQDRGVWRVGVLVPYPEADEEAQARVQTFRQALANLGWVEGRNIRIDVRWAGTDQALQRRLARELVALAPHVIMTATATATRVMREVTQTIPIVFVQLVDPVEAGIVSNLPRPESNVTGFMIYDYSLAGKWLSLLKDMTPRISRVALLYVGSGDSLNRWTPIALEAGERRDLKVTVGNVLNLAELESAIAGMADGNDGGVVFLPSPFILANRAATIALAAKYRVPAIYYARIYAADGGLISYGADPNSQYHDGANYVDRILRGAKPGDLPVQFATKFELVLNVNTAKALDLDVSQQLQFLADEVIE